MLHGMLMHILSFISLLVLRQIPFFLFLLCVLGRGALQAQSPELGAVLGGVVYSGDLHPTGIQLSASRPVGGFFYRQQLSASLSTRISALVGKLSGNDNAQLDVLALERAEAIDVSFGELALVLEYYFNPRSSYSYKQGRTHLSPYVFGGIGGMFFSGYADPVAEYSRIQPIIPFGLGLRLQSGRSFVLGLEVGLRKTFFDYLDNISAGSDDKRFDYGDRYSTDSYHYVGLSVSFVIHSLRCPFPVKRPERRY